MAANVLVPVLSFWCYTWAFKMFFQTVPLASIQCQNVLTKHFFQREPWHFGVAVILRVTHLAFIHRLSVGVMPRPQPCLVQWRWEVIITHHYTWCWWCFKGDKQTSPILSSFFPLLPFFFTHSHLTYPHPLFPAPHHVICLKLHTSVAWNTCHLGKLYVAVNLG